MAFSQKVASVLAYLQYYTKAKTIYDVHSPMLSKFCMNCLVDQRNYYAFDQIEQLRNELKNSDNIIELRDYGAGSKKHKSKSRKIKDIVKFSSSSPSKGRMLFRITNYFQADHILELGTNLGISSLYMAHASSKANIDTIEGDPSLLEIAKKNSAKVGINNIKYHLGSFNEVLPQLLSSHKKYDLVYIDGDHTEHATLENHNRICKNLSDKAIIIFDDIHWSYGMTNAWNQIINEAGHSFSIDLFGCGIIIHGIEVKEPLNISFVDYKYKPWRIGLFA